MPVLRTAAAASVKWAREIGAKSETALRRPFVKKNTSPQSLWPANSTLARQNICWPRCEQSKIPASAFTLSTGWL